MNSDITISLSQVFWIVGGITAVAAFLKWAMQPIRAIENHETRITALEKAEQDRKATDRYTTMALNAIVNHMIDGNSVDKLKTTREELRTYIIEHN